MTDNTADANRQLLSDMYAAGVRIGTVIHVAGALVDLDSPSDPIKTFIDDEAYEGYVQVAFDPDWPGYSAAISKMLEAYHQQAEINRQSAEQIWLETVGDYLLRHCPKQYIVGVEYQIRHCLVADPRHERMGGWQCSWGHYGTDWMLVDDVCDAMRKGLAIAKEHAKDKWQEAINAGRIYTRQSAKTGKGGAV